MLSQQQQNPNAPQVIYPSAGTYPQQGQAQIMQGQPGQMIVIQTGCADQSGPTVYKNYFSKGSFSLGCIQLGIGFLLIILNIVAISIGADQAQVSHGIWGGIWLIMTGAFGVAAGRTKKLCPILTFMLLSILASLICLSAVVLFGLAAAWDEDRYRYYLNYGLYWDGDPISASKSRTRIGVNATMALLSGVAGILAVISSAMCCTAICCGRTASSGLVISQATTGTQPNQQVVYLPSAPGGIATGGQLQPMPTASAPGYTVEAPPDYSTVEEKQRL